MSLREDFYEKFGGTTNARSFYSPARINIIGEHTDYNGGYVFPCTLDFGTYGVARKREDNVVRLKSLLYDGEVTFDIDNFSYKKEDGWANYVKGVIDEFIKAGHTLGGFEILINSNMPLSSGLSSSASIEVLISKVLETLFELNVSGVDMAILSQKAENNFMNLKCGIMDQFIIANGKKDKAMLLKCDTLEYTLYDLNLKNYKIVICNTNKPRNLIESKYNERLEECFSGLEIFKKFLNINCLAELSIENFEKYKKEIKDEKVLKRVKHVVFETKRTLDATKAMEDGNLKLLGELVTSSHNSLRDLYEVTGFELDTMVNIALKQDGVLGARMTGAGFGGCAISLVEETLVDDFIKKVGTDYEKSTKLVPSFYIANIGSGVTELL
ncbi:MAG: galactokinase [Lachnospirales bacterium]